MAFKIGSQPQQMRKSASQPLPQKKVLANSLPSLLVIMLCFLAAPVMGQDIWEYSPYRVQVWLAVDPAMAMSNTELDTLKRRLSDQLDLTFGPTWSTKVDEAPLWFKPTMLENLDNLNSNLLSAGDFVLVVPKKNETTDKLRSLESFVEKGFDVLVPRKFLSVLKDQMKPPSEPPPHERVKDQLRLLVSKKVLDLVEAQMINDPKSMELDKFKESLKSEVSAELITRILKLMEEKSRPPAIIRLKDQLRPTDKTSAQLAEEVATGQTTAAIILKNDFQNNEAKCRSIVMRLQNQSDNLLQQIDKIFFVAITPSNESPELIAREFDCPTRQFSIVNRSKHFYSPNHLALPLARLIQSSFTPVARIEESSTTSAKLRVRAGGLVSTDDHPILIRQGDVLLPVIRRDDRNGLPTLIESIPWTYIAVTEVNREHLSGAVFSGLRGAMEGRRNGRTLRLALLAKPNGTYSDVQIVTQLSKNTPLSGTQIFERFPGGSESKILGRTDWRGQIRIQPPSDRVVVTIESPIKDPAKAALSEKEATAPASPPAAENSPNGGEATAVSTTSATKSKDEKNASNGTAKPAETATSAAEVPMETKTYPLNVPLVLLYVKNGETLLARLPIVVGLQPLYVAEVPDDSRRLEAEAFLRGLQSEVVDLVALRQVAAARVRLRMEEGKLDQAKQLVDELRQLKDYEKMARDLDNVQRQVLDPASGPLTPVAQLRIEKMFQQTRELLQKYLQNDLVQKVEKELDARLKGTPLPTTDAEKK